MNNYCTFIDQAQIYLFFRQLTPLFLSQKNWNLIKNLLSLNCQEIPQNIRTYFARLQKSRSLHTGCYCFD